jgi:osmotically-inducible protein OsmY
MGCTNTAEGVKQDTAQAADATQKAAEVAANETKKAADTVATETQKATDTAATETQKVAKDASAALALTPKVKTALISDEMLKDVRNRIDVDSADNVVHLKGHVISAEMKKRAGEVAQKVLTDANATDKLSNELEVRP